MCVQACACIWVYECSCLWVGNLGDWSISSNVSLDYCNLKTSEKGWGQISHLTSSCCGPSSPERMLDCWASRRLCDGSSSATGLHPARGESRCSVLCHETARVIVLNKELWKWDRESTSEHRFIRRKSQGEEYPTEVRSGLQLTRDSNPPCFQVQGLNYWVQREVSNGWLTLLGHSMCLDMC